MSLLRSGTVCQKAVAVVRLAILGQEITFKDKERVSNKIVLLRQQNNDG